MLASLSQVEQSLLFSRTTRQKSEPGRNGLTMVLPDARDLRHGRNLMMEGVDRKEFEKFLQQSRKGK